MNKLIIIPFLLISLLAKSQSNIALIDHDRKFNFSHAYMATDSLIYYTQDGFEPMSLCSIDTTGVIERTRVSEYNTARAIKFVNKSAHRFDVLYYKLFDIDIWGFGIVEANVRNGVINHRPRITDLYDHTDIDLSPDTDTLFVLDPVGFNTDLSGLRLYSPDDQIIGDINITDNHDYKYLQRHNVNTLLMWGDHIVSRVNSGPLSLDTLHNNNATIRSVVSHKEQLFLRTDQAIYNLDVTTGDTSSFYVHTNSDDLIDLKSSEGQLTILIKDDQETNHVISVSDDGIIGDTLYSMPVIHRTYQMVNGDLFIAWQNYNYEFAVNPTWNIYRKNLLEQPKCIDVSIDEMSLYNSSNELIQVDTFSGIILETIRRTYDYSITLSNLGTEDIDSLHIYSEDYFRFLDDIEMPHFREPVYDLFSGETRVLEGSFLFSRYDDRIDSLSFHIPGGDHMVDCDMENNTYQVSPILSNTQNVKVDMYKMMITPNPSDSYISLNIDGSNMPYSIHNLAGQKVLHGSYENRLKINHLKSGIYFLKINNKSLKFIKL